MDAPSTELLARELVRSLDNTRHQMAATTDPDKIRGFLEHERYLLEGLERVLREPEETRKTSWQKLNDT